MDLQAEMCPFCLVIIPLGPWSERVKSKMVNLSGLGWVGLGMGVGGGCGFSLEMEH